jgi:hypothetical protein
VLEGQAVYWMALDTIPRSILNKIRQLMYSFLWTGGNNKHSLHLCRWDIIAKPKAVGGWGLRNLALFKQALATKTLWRVLTQDGIWHRIIHGKYITPFHLQVGSDSQIFSHLAPLRSGDLS